MTELPPLNSLRAFDAAGRRLSFRAAADELGVTQGAVAQHVRLLEAHLGITLFLRVPKGLELTQSGRIYHARIAEAFASLRSATAELKPITGKVVISVTPSFAAKWLIPHLPDFTRVHPDIDLRIMATERLSSFHSDGVDLAVRQGSPPFGAALQASLLFKHEVIAVAASGQVGDGHADPFTQDLARLPKIHDTHDFWPRYLAQLGIKDQTTRGLELSQTALAIDAAIAGQGVALVNRFLVAQDLSAGRLAEVGPPRQVGGHDFYLLAQRSAAQLGPVMRVARWLEMQSAQDARSWAHEP